MKMRISIARFALLIVALLIAPALGAATPQVASMALSISDDVTPLVQNVEYDPDEVADFLADEGYYKISITDATLPHYGFYGCKHGRSYKLKVDGFGAIIKRSRRGNCAGVHVRAPFVSVDVDDGVRVRAPFVDIRIGR